MPTSVVRFGGVYNSAWESLRAGEWPKERIRRNNRLYYVTGDHAQTVRAHRKAFHHANRLNVKGQLNRNLFAWIAYNLNWLFQTIRWQVTQVRLAQLAKPLPKTPEKAIPRKAGAALDA